MGAARSRLDRRREGRGREYEDPFENYTTGTLTPREAVDWEDGREVDDPYRRELDRQTMIDLDPMYYRDPDLAERVRISSDTAGRNVLPLTEADDEDASVFPSGGSSVWEFGWEDGNDRVVLPTVPGGDREPDGEALPLTQEVVEQRPGGKASLVLINDSIYTVSYSVIREDGNMQHVTRSSSNERRELLIKQASRKNTAVGRLLASLQRKEEEDRDTTKEMVDDDAEHFLMRDHRMAPVGETLPTEVLFPANCEELRVRAYSQRWQGERCEWKQYMNKVYSTTGLRDRTKKKVFTIVASNSDIEGWKLKDNADSNIEKLTVLGRHETSDTSDDSSDGLSEISTPLSCSLANPWASRPCLWSPGSNCPRGYESED